MSGINSNIEEGTWIGSVYGESAYDFSIYGTYFSEINSTLAIVEINCELQEV